MMSEVCPSFEEMVMCIHCWEKKKVEIRHQLVLSNKELFICFSFYKKIVCLFVNVFNKSLLIYMSGQQVL